MSLDSRLAVPVVLWLGVVGRRAGAAPASGDLATARMRYREYLALMQQGDGARAELEIARGALSGR